MYKKLLLLNNYELEEYIYETNPLAIFVPNSETKNKLPCNLKCKRIHILRSDSENIYRGRTGEEVIIYIDSDTVSHYLLKKVFNVYIYKFLTVSTIRNKLAVIMNIDTTVDNKSIEDSMLQNFEDQCVSLSKHSSTN